MSNSIRLSVNISGSLSDAIRSLADRRSATVTSIIRDAVSTEKFLDDRVQAGDVVILRSKDGTERELIWKKRS